MCLSCFGFDDIVRFLHLDSFFSLPFFDLLLKKIFFSPILLRASYSHILPPYSNNLLLFFRTRRRDVCHRIDISISRHAGYLPHMRNDRRITWRLHSHGCGQSDLVQKYMAKQKWNDFFLSELKYTILCRHGACYYYCGYGKPLHYNAIRFNWTEEQTRLTIFFAICQRNSIWICRSSRSLVPNDSFSMRFL